MRTNRITGTGRLVSDQSMSARPAPLSSREDTLKRGGGVRPVMNPFFLLIFLVVRGNIEFWL